MTEKFKKTKRQQIVEDLLVDTVAGIDGHKKPITMDTSSPIVMDTSSPMVTNTTIRKDEATDKIYPEEVKLEKSMSHYERVRSFMSGAGQDVPGSPCIPPDSVLVARLRLLFEELIEVANSFGFEVKSTNHDIDSVNQIVFQRAEFFDRCVPAIAKELSDLQVVTTGSFVAVGVDPGPILEVVDEDNLKKLAQGRLDEHGKFVKPPGWQKVDLKPALRDQGWPG